MIESEYNAIKFLVAVLFSPNEDETLQFLPAFLALVLVPVLRKRYLWLIALSMVGLITCSALSIIN